MKPGPSPHTRGFVITVTGVLILCPDTLLIRLAEAQGLDQWTIAFWRGIFTSAGILVFYRCLHGKGALREGLRLDAWMILAALLMAVQALAFVLSVANTAVANTLVIIATGPLFTALLAWLFTEERPPLRTWITIAAALLGMLVIFHHDLNSKGLFGDALALVSAIGLGGTFVIVRHRKAVNMMPAMSAGMFLSALAVLPATAPLAINAGGLGFLVLQGLLVMPLSFGLLTLGPRYLPAPEVSLLLLMETVLAPWIVWMAIGEPVSNTTALGGAVILIALAVNAVLGLTGRAHSAE
ncbi:MAG: DMT family transporter [Arenicellales bacterium]